MMVHQRAFGSVRKRHHHLESIALLLAWRLPTPSPPFFNGANTLSQAIQAILLSSKEPPQKKFLLRASSFLMVLDGALKREKNILQGFQARI